MKLLTDPRGDRVLEVFDRHGHSLHLVASILADDAVMAERLVVQAIAAHHSGPCTLRGLSAAVYIAWAAWGPSATIGIPRPVDGPIGTACLSELHDLPDDQRAAVALCRFGGHTYRQAADVLDLPDHQVAGLLCSALRRLAAPRAIVPSRIA